MALLLEGGGLMVCESSSDPTFASACLHHPIFGDSFHLKTYQAAEFVRTIGSPIEECGIVDYGCLKTTGYTIEGQERCSGYFYKGDVFPELLYFTGNKEYGYDLVAVTTAAVAWINAKTFAVMLQEDRRLSYLFVLYLSKRGLKSQMLLGLTCYRTVRERVAFWILWMEKIAADKRILVPSQVIWANELRVARASLNKEIGRMEDQNFFSIKDHLLEILDREGLERLL